MNTIDSESQEQFHVSSVRYFPEEWDNKTLLDAVGMKKDLIVAGPFGSNLKVSDYKDEGIPIIRLQNIDYGKFIDKEIKYISHEKARELAYHSFRAGDLVLAKLGDPIGKTCIVPDYFKDGIVVADVVRVRVADGLVDKKFIMYSLNSVATKNQLINGTIGSTRPRVNLDQIRDIQILVPPLNEQRKIAAILSSVDAAIEQTDAIIGVLKAIRAGITKDLLSKGLDEYGHLKDPAVHPERSIDSDLGVVPTGWNTTKVGDLGLWRGGSTPSKSSSFNWDGDILWISPKDVIRDDLIDSEDKITQEALLNYKMKLFDAGDILVVFRSGILRHTFPIAFTRLPFTVNQDIKVLSPKIGVHNRFAFFALRALGPVVLKSAVKSGTSANCQPCSATVTALPASSWS